MNLSRSRHKPEDNHLDNESNVIESKGKPEVEKLRESLEKCPEGTEARNSTHLVNGSDCCGLQESGIDSNRNLHAFSSTSQQNADNQAQLCNGLTLHDISQDDVNLLTQCLEKNPASIFYRRPLDSEDSESTEKTQESTEESKGKNEQETEADVESLDSDFTDQKVKDSQSSSSSPLSSSPLPNLRHLRTLLSRKQKDDSVTMPLAPRFAQLRNRQSMKETKTVAKTESKGDDDWADISSLDAVSLGSSQADVASTSTDDSSSKMAPVGIVQVHVSYLS